MNYLSSPRSPFQIFAVSAVISVVALALVAIYLGWMAAAVTAMLIVIEITFSFDNAIINARVLATMSSFWQRIFMTVGILIAVFGMRIIFPILVVMATASLSWGQVISLALSHPDLYAQELSKAHPSIAAFGGMFLLMLCLHFFFDSRREVRWLPSIERPMQDVARWWLAMAICLALLVGIIALPLHTAKSTVFIAGLTGIGVYLLIHGISEIFTRRHEQAERKAGMMIVKTGLAGLTAFLYLEVLDASFSFDGVIGAFAITQDVVLIAIGLGVGALWVRSLTLFMVRRKVLHAYQYLEHGAHYTIGALSVVLLAGLFFDIPEMIAGLFGIVIIAMSVVASVKENRLRQA